MVVVNVVTILVFKALSNVIVKVVAMVMVEAVVALQTSAWASTNDPSSLRPAVLLLS